MRHLVAGLAGGYVGGAVGAVCNTVATLLLALLVGKPFWIGNLLFAAGLGMVLGGATGAAAGLRQSGASVLARLAAASGPLFVLWIVFRSGMPRDHEVRVTAAIPLLWAVGLLVWAVACRTPDRT
jgi:hypothetical protein